VFYKPFCFAFQRRLFGAEKGVVLASKTSHYCKAKA